MKKIITAIIVFAFIANVSAQLEINSLGQVGIGDDPNGNPFRIYNTTYPSFIFEGSNAKLQIGVAVGNGWFSSIAQAGNIVYRPLTTASGIKQGLIFCLASSHNDGNHYIKFGDEYNGGWVSILNNRKMIIDGNVGVGKTPTFGMLDVNGSIYSGGNIVLTSDERLKTEIKPLSDEKDKLYLLKGKSYKKTPPPSGITEVMYDENGEELPVKEREIIEFSEYGYLAQELKEVFPDLVSQDSEGYYGVNYIGLIPIIVEAMKEQQLQIEALQAEVLKSVVLRSAADETESPKMIDPVIAQCKLYQNAPNPFSQNTQIKFYIAEGVKKALLCIYDLQGSQIKQIVITERGEGSQTISGSELPAGMYLYALIADGKEVDVKRMVLTK